MIPWKKIKSEYVTQNCGYRDLAKKYNISLYAVGQRGKKEKWVQLREEYGDKKYTKTVQKTLEKQAEKRANELIAAEEACAGIIDIAASIIADPGQFTRHLVKLRQGHGEGVYREELIEEDKSIIDARRLKDLAAALETATKLSRTLKGILDEPVKQKLAIEREKLEIDRTKAGLDTEDEDETGIVEIPGLVDVDLEDGIDLGTLDLDKPEVGGNG